MFSTGLSLLFIVIVILLTRAYMRNSFSKKHMYPLLAIILFAVEKLACRPLVPAITA